MSGKTLGTAVADTLASLRRLEPRLVAVYRFGTNFGQTAHGPHTRLLVLVDRIERELLDQLGPLALGARQDGIALRLETREGLFRGADAFPVFSLELKQTGELLWGEDALTGLEVESDHLRLRVEQSLRVIHRDLTRAYLDQCAAPAPLATALRRATRRLVYLFQAAFRLLAGEATPAREPQAVVEAFCGALFGEPQRQPWSTLVAFGAGQSQPAGAELVALYGDVLVALAEVIEGVDRLEAA